MWVKMGQVVARFRWVWGPGLFGGGVGVGFKAGLGFAYIDWPRVSLGFL